MNAVVESKGSGQITYRGPLEEYQPVSEEKVFKLPEGLPQEILERASFKNEEITKLIEILKRHFPLMQMPVNHYIANGLYARELRVDADTLVIGKFHLKPGVSFLLKGEALLFSTGAGAVRLKAPATFLTPPGNRIVGIALTDVIFTSVTATNESELEDIEAEGVVDTLEELQAKVALMIVK